MSDTPACPNDTRCREGGEEPNEPPYSPSEIALCSTAQHGTVPCDTPTVEEALDWRDPIDVSKWTVEGLAEELKAAPQTGAKMLISVEVENSTLHSELSRLTAERNAWRDEVAQTTCTRCGAVTVASSGVDLALEIERLREAVKQAHYKLQHHSAAYDAMRILQAALERSDHE